MEVWVGDKKAPVLMTIGESGVACFGRSEPQFRETVALYHELLKVCHILRIKSTFKPYMCGIKGLIEECFQVQHDEQ